MNEKIYPSKLAAGDEVRIVAPSRSMSIIAPELRQIADKRFVDLGLKLSFGKHVDEFDDFRSSSIASRVADIHEAFSDKNVKAIISVIGGFNCNQLLRYLDWGLIKNNPKIFCGYSDISALNNAIYAKTALVNYSGPAYSSLGQKLHLEYTLDYFQKCLFTEQPFEIMASQQWSDDPWYKNQDDRKLIDNAGFLTIHEGQASGTIIGANMCTFNLLQGTEYCPSLQNSILFLEDDELSSAANFDRDLQSLIHLPEFPGVKGLVIGRFQNASKVTDDLLRQIIATKKELANIPVIANVDFGHTDPKITFPIGGEAELKVRDGKAKLTIVRH